MAKEEASPWVMDEPGNIKALWFNGSNALTTSAATPLTAFSKDGSRPYEGVVQTVTICMDASHLEKEDGALKPELLVDGSLSAAPSSAAFVNINPHTASEDVRKNDDYDADSDFATYAPVAVSMLINGNIGTPHNATVQMRTTNKVFATADIPIARPTDAMAEVALVPFPLRHSTVSVEARYKVKSSDGDNDDERFETRQLGYLSEAIQRIRTGFRKVEAAADNNIPGVKKDEDDDDAAISLPGLEKTILLSMRNPNEARFDFTADPEEQDTYLQITLTMRKGDADDAKLVWKLRPTDDAARTVYWKHFENKRSNVDAVIKEMNDLYGSLKTKGVYLGPEELRDGRYNALKAKIRKYAESGDNINARGRGPNTKSNIPLRVWGPVLKLAAVKVPKLPTGVPEAEMEARKAVAATTRRLRDYFNRLGSIQLVSWHEAFDTSTLTTIGTSAKVGGSPGVVHAVVNNAHALDSMRMAPLYPVGVACSLGTFESSESVATTERVVQEATNENPTTAESNADIFRRLGIDHSPESVAALAAFSDLVVHMCTRAMLPSYGWPTVSVKSCVARAMKHAHDASTFVVEVCAKPDVLFSGTGDARFFTMKGGTAAAIALRHLPVWKAITSTSPDGSTWSPTARKSASKFASMLSRIATGKLEAHPTTFPFMATQTLWTWPQSVKTEEELSIQSAALEEMRRKVAIDDAGIVIKRSDHAQFVTAKQAMRRVDALISGFELNSASNKVHAVRRSIVISRPSITIGTLGDGQIARIDDGLKTQEDLSDHNTIDPSMVRASWARRALHVYDKWTVLKQEVRNANGIDGAIKMMANLAVKPDVGVQVKYHVPFGLPPGRSPLSSMQLTFSEMRVWTMATSFVLRNDIPKDDRADMSINMKLCLPSDTSIPIQEPTRSSLHPNVEPLVLLRTDTAVTIPVCVNAYDEAVKPNVEDASAGIVYDTNTRLAVTIADVREKQPNPAVDQPDRYRCIIFSTERIWQALTLAIASEVGIVDIVIPKQLQEQHTKRLVVAAILACGALPRSTGAVVLRPRIVGEDDNTTTTVNGMVGEMQRCMLRVLAEGLYVVPLSEMAAVLALWSA